MTLSRLFTRNPILPIFRIWLHCSFRPVPPGLWYISVRRLLFFCLTVARLMLDLPYINRTTVVRLSNDCQTIVERLSHDCDLIEFHTFDSHSTVTRLIVVRLIHDSCLFTSHSYHLYNTCVATVTRPSQDIHATARLSRECEILRRKSH